MKKQNLKTFSKAYLKKLTQTPNQFKVNQMLKDVDTTQHRLYAPLLTWCFLTQKRVPTISSLYHELQTLKEELSQNCTEEDLLSFYQQSNNMELIKFVEAYQNENRQRDENELKNNYRDALKKLQKQKHVSDYKMCKLANLQAANFSAFYHHHQNNRLSLQKCKTLLHALYEL